jgi:hypothetical protein
MAVVALSSSTTNALIHHPTVPRVANQVGQCSEATRPASVGAAAPGGSAAPDADKKVREQEAADKLAQERARLKIQIEANITRVRYCVAGNPGCSATGFHRLLLGLTRSEVESLLGPPQYQLHLAGNQLYYWTISINVASGRKAPPRMAVIRVQVRYGDCYYREKNSRKSAVCEAGLY